MARAQYLLPVLMKYLKRQEQSCPHCGSNSTSLVGRKFLALQLRHCPNCKLSFRWPKDELTDNMQFYNKFYVESNGITTKLPTHYELNELILSSFANTDKDFRPKISLLKQYKQSGSLLDYGASWGYGTWQLQQAGYQVTGFEIDKERAAYGRKNLDIDMLDNFQTLYETKNRFEIIFTSHVLEHLPNLKTIFTDFYTLLVTTGLLIIFVPNCSGIEIPEVFQKKKSFAFGEKHSFAYTKEFFENNLPKYGFSIEKIGVSPYYTIGSKQELISGAELMVIASRIK